MTEDFILARIPHRPPFLWIDRVVDITNDTIQAEKVVPVDLAIFQGHYPEYPLMPGVLLCEAVFQAGAVLIAELMGRETQTGGNRNGSKESVPVLTRILGAKFKREVRPGDTLEISATLVERMGPAWLLKGKVRVGGKVAVQVEFACARKGA